MHLKSWEEIHIIITWDKQIEIVKYFLYKYFLKPQIFNIFELALFFSQCQHLWLVVSHWLALHTGCLQFDSRAENEKKLCVWSQSHPLSLMRIMFSFLDVSNDQWRYYNVK